MTEINVTHSILLILVIAGVTASIRFAPFVIFQKKTPNAVLYLGKVLPFAIIGMLVVYCLKNVNPFSKPYGIPELISVVMVAGLHKWKHNTLLSIVTGTVLYMILLHFC